LTGGELNLDKIDRKLEIVLSCAEYGPKPQKKFPQKYFGKNFYGGKSKMAAKNS
jgi:hypothetical protein